MSTFLSNQVDPASTCEKCEGYTEIPKAWVSIYPPRMCTCQPSGDNALVDWEARAKRAEKELRTMIRDHDDCGCMTCRFAGVYLRELTPK